MGRLRAKSDYEELRNARISENQARLASLGLQKTVSELRSLICSSPKSDKRKWNKVDYSSTPLRRSSRLTGKSTSSQGYLRVGKSPPSQGEIWTGKLPASQDFTKLIQRLIVSYLRVGKSPPSQGELGYLRGKSPPSLGKLSHLEDSDCGEDGEERRLANGPLTRGKSGLRSRLISPEALARRCASKGRGSLYDPVYGICCHFCRQKKLCGEEDCKRCGEQDMDQPCIGKTDCSICHSSNGILCRACLKVRYGEEMEEVRSNKDWICPHCMEDKGINPYWICNSSLCLKKRKMVPTGIAIFRAREMGYKSVAHLLMDELQRSERRR